MNMFKPQNAKTVTEYFSMIDEPRRSEVKEIHKLIRKVAPKLDTFIVHNIIGYGKYHYKSKSGREGDWFALGLASQKNYISVYVCLTKDGKYIPEIYKDKLGKVSVGKSCIRFTKVEKVDLKVLETVLKEGLKLFKDLNSETFYSE